MVVLEYSVVLSISVDILGGTVVVSVSFNGDDEIDQVAVVTLDGDDGVAASVAVDMIGSAALETPSTGGNEAIVVLVATIVGGVRSTDASAVLPCC